MTKERKHFTPEFKQDAALSGSRPGLQHQRSLSS